MIFLGVDTNKPRHYNVWRVITQTDVDNLHNEYSHIVTGYCNEGYAFIHIPCPYAMQIKHNALSHQLQSRCYIEDQHAWTTWTELN